MSVSFRVAGTWAELTADGAVAIPPTPQAGDRMYLFARWKDFSVTAQVTSPVVWTELVEFADGTVSAGNGTGSVKVACWYRDWQAGDTDPTIDFSANPDNASAVIIVMQKDAADVWLTPVAVTAAMTTWTTTSQSVSASATVAVPSSGVVMGLIGIRDDTAVMTRPTNGIDDSGGLVTWNGNYVESPATHHSTTTGFDGAADLGYRLVSVGATATLRMTGTISAAETGAALWVVQGVEINLSVANSSHAHSAENVALTQVHSLTVESGSHAHSATSPALTQTHAISAQDATHSHEAANVILTQVHSLTVQDAAHVHAADSPAVAVIHHLEVQHATHAHSVESPSLTQEHSLAVDSATHSHTAESPVVKTISIIFIDPGGDAVQLPGYFNNDPTPGLMTFDSTQQVVGVGSYKFDSDTGVAVIASISGVLSQSRRVSCYFRYDSIPDELTERSEFLSTSPSEAYSGGGFDDAVNVEADDGVYATATPARNGGQGSRCIPASLLSIPANAIIDSVKIIYERKYDTDTSIGISRVKWVIDGVEGPSHDNTDQPLTDTVVEVDVTDDRFWEPQDFDAGSFEVVAEARRGDTDTAHTQSWDYVKVEVVYHLATNILAATDNDNHALFTVGLNPKDDRSVLRFTDGNNNWFDGITPLLVDAWNRLSVSYVLNAADDLDVKLHVNGIEELSIEQASTGGFSGLTNLLYGWVTSPGVDRLCWFDQIYIDDGDDLSDPGNVLMTAKLPASVNEDEWNSTTGTGAVDERPLSETNYKRETRATSFRQTYTLESDDEGDIDISGETLLGYMGWAWARVHVDDVDHVDLVVNGVDINRTSQIKSTASLLRHSVTSSVYPSNPAGIGMTSNPEATDTYLYECGAVEAYLGPPENEPLLEFQLLQEDSITPASDDVSVENPETYAIQSEVALAPGATVTTTIYSVEGGVPRQQAVIESTGGEETGRVVVAPGEEIVVSVEVTGADAEVGLTRTLNVD